MMTSRRRYIPNLSSHREDEYSRGERQALNSSIQGFASDFFKSAILRLQRRIESLPEVNFNGGMPCKQVHASYLDVPPLPPARLVLQVHDEMIYEVERNRILEVARVIKDELVTNEKNLGNVPVQVRIKIGDRWGSLEEWELPAEEAEYECDSSFEEGERESMEEEGETNGLGSAAIDHGYRMEEEETCGKYE